MMFERRPIQYGVTVDGRQVGETYNNSSLAGMVREQLQEEAPWSIVEVQKYFSPPLDSRF